ncbi:MAG: DNA polymerase III subunit alpha [Erysipelotrichales bacterium]
MKFTNLNVRSHYTLLNSTLKVDDIINNAIDNDYNYVAISDYNSFSYALELYFKAKKHNLTPIFSLSFSVQLGDKLLDVSAYALNFKGFKNLEKISSIISLSNQPLSIEQYNQYKDNIVIVIDILSSTLYQDFLLNEKINNKIYLEYKEVFDNFYYSFSNYLDTNFINKFRAIHLHENEIYASRINYKKNEDASLHYLLRCIDTGEKASKLLLKQNGGNHFINRDDLDKLNKDILSNTSNFISLFSSISLPVYDSLPLYKKDEAEIRNYLKQLCIKGLYKRFNNNVSDEYLKRLAYELSVVNKMGFDNYFLIVYDYVLFAKKNDILVGAGRGSSAGSLIAYCLGITNVDPIDNNLLFERFLNPERVSLPDIDVDFQDDRRDDVVTYLKDTYGHDMIGHITTYGTFQAKNSIRDLGRVLEIANYRLDLLLKLIPSVLNVKLDKLYHESKEIQALLQANNDLAYLFNKAIQLEGINRHVSTHAAGIIIGRHQLMEYVPVTKGINDTLMVQYSMDYLESIGLFKMDILGLKNLGIIKDILNDIDEDINLDKIDLNDKKTFNMISNGNTLGIFQFESSGVIKVLKKMNVSSLNDMVATTALYRPGPMQFIDEYIARKNGLKEFSYIHPSLEDILSETYGIIVYQEQIMQITQKMANFSLARADIVRKGMAKKNEKLLQEIKTDFISASIENGYSEEIAAKVYDMILLFSNYGFNKAHAYSYALLAYYMAYLKANYPIVFFKNILSANIYSISKIKQYLHEMKQVGLDIVAPNINISTTKFEIIDDNFILPLISIKGLGESNTKTIIDERNTNGEFKDYFDAVLRLVSNKISVGVIEKLIYGGAFDCFALTRRTMIENLSSIEQYIAITKSDSNQLILEIDSIPKPKIVKYTEDYEVAQKELELLGLYLSNHPLNNYSNQYPNALLEDITNQSEALVIVERVKEIRTKKGELMAFVDVSDLYETKTLVVFPKIYSKVQQILVKSNILLVKGRIDDKDKENIILNEALQLK